MNHRQSVSRGNDSLVVDGVLWVSEVKDNTGVGLSAATVGELLAKVDGAVEGQATIFLDIDVERLEVGGGVDDTNLTGLDKVVGDDQVLLVGCDLDVVRADSGLVLIGVIKTLDVVQVTDVQSGDVVGSSESGVEVAAVLADVGAVVEVRIRDLSFGRERGGARRTR